MSGRFGRISAWVKRRGAEELLSGRWWLSGAFWLGVLLLLVAARAEDPVYKETIIEPIPDPGPVAGGAADAECDCGKSGADFSLWLGPTEAEPEFFLSGTAGGSYFDTSPKTSLGGAYSLNFSAPIAGQWGVGAIGMANHYDGGSQYFVNLGAYRWSNFYGNFTDRIGADFSITQFTDTGLGSPYFVLGNVQADYKFYPGVRAGVDYVFPIHGDDATILVPGGGNFSDNIRPLESVNAYLRVGGIRQNLNLLVGYVDKLDTVTYGLGVTQPVGERVSLAFNAFYDQDPGLWTSFLGVQVDFSPNRISRRLAGYTAPGDVVRGESSSDFSSQMSGFLSDEDYQGDQKARQAKAMLAAAQADARVREELNRKIEESFKSSTPQNFVSMPNQHAASSPNGNAGGGGGFQCPPGTTQVGTFSNTCLICKNNTTGVQQVVCPP